MDISTLTLKLIILLFPGLVAAFIYKRLTIKHHERTDFMFSLLAVMQGILSYLCLQLLYFIYTFVYNLFSAANINYEVLKTFKNISDSVVIPYLEVILATFLAVVIGIFNVKMSHHNVLNKLAFRFKISNKYGDENLYSNFLNENCLQWVYVKDIQNSLMYKGAVGAFAESADFKELVLNEVSVFTYPGCDKLYDVPKIYLCFPKDKIIIEQANIITQENEERNT